MHKIETAKSGRDVNFEFINIDCNSGMLKMMRAVKEGKSLVIFIDGGSGLGGFNRRDNKVQAINFLGKKIYSRKGVAFLSHHLKIPIVPVISYRNDNYTNITIEFHKEIAPWGDRTDYIAKATQQLWENFEKYIDKDPSQWEAMIYARHFEVCESFSDRKDVVSDQHIYQFNESDIDFIHIDNSLCVYNIKNNRSFKPSEKLFNLLLYLKENKIHYPYSRWEKIMNKNILTELIREGVLEPINMK